MGGGGGSRRERVDLHNLTGNIDRMSDTVTPIELKSEVLPHVSPNTK